MTGVYRSTLGERSYDIVVGDGAIDGSRPCSRAGAGGRGRHPARASATARRRARRPRSTAPASRTRRSSWAKARTPSRSRPSRSSAASSRSGVCCAATSSSRSAAESSATPPASRPRSTTAASTSCRCPTTLLAMVDAAIGGKTGVNLPEGKNLVGAFHQPLAVFADPTRARDAARPRVPLRARRDRQVRVDGRRLRVAARRPTLARARSGGRSPRSIAAVRRDQGARRRGRRAERTGARAVLNYGHTLAHALETATGHALLHGEAVAIGLVFAAQLAAALERIDRRRRRRSTRRSSARSGCPSTRRRRAARPTTCSRSWSATRSRAAGSRSCSTGRTESSGSTIPTRPPSQGARRDRTWRGKLMATILLLSGPNLNLLGEREPEHYGTTTLDELVALARETAAKRGHELEHVQSNHEGALIDAIHAARGRCAAIVINAGRVHALRVRAHRRARDVRRREDRGAPLEPGRPRSVAAPLGDRARRRRHDHRLARRRLPPRDRSRRDRSGGREDDVTLTTHARPARRRAAARPAARALRRRELDALLVTKLAERSLPHRVHRLGRDAARHAPTTRCSSPTAGTPSSRTKQLGARGRRRPRSRSALTGAGAARAARRRGRGRARGSGSRTTASRGRDQRDFVDHFDGVELVPAGALVEDLRRVKDAARSTASARACAIADDAFQSLLPRLARRHHRAPVRARARVRDARTRRERQQLRSDHRGRARTARSRTPVPSDRVIGRNELVVCDFGCIVDGYCSDMTRTVSVGDPGPDARHLYDVVLRASTPGAPWSRPTSRAPTSTARRATSSPTRAGPSVLAFDRSRSRSRDPRGAAGGGDRP